MVYGPLTDGATSVIFEGATTSPDQYRNRQIIENYGVTVHYASPASINAFRKGRREISDAHDTSPLRLIGGMGTSNDPAAWRWYRQLIGGGRCPVVDTWWQPETGAIMIASPPGVIAAELGSPSLVVPGISAHIVDEESDLVPCGGRGWLVADRPWPSMLRGIWGDEERFIKTYWSQFDGRAWYFTGVEGQYDDEDAIWVRGRGDDTIMTGSDVA